MNSSRQKRLVHPKELLRNHGSQMPIRPLGIRYQHSLEYVSYRPYGRYDDQLLHLTQQQTGQIKLKISEGTQSGKTIRLKGKGMPIYNKINEFGDLYIQLEINIPNKLTEKQKELFEQLKSTL